jgi:hypothetical protein
VSANPKAIFVMIAVLAVVTTSVFAQFAIPWHTIDGGGAMNSTGGLFTVSGTIGQPDAQVAPVMSGGGFSVTGGFWSATLVCTLPGDTNLDGSLNGSDVQGFVDCLLGSGVNCHCNDMDGNGAVDSADISPLVAILLAP